MRSTSTPPTSRRSSARSRSRRLGCAKNCKKNPRGGLVGWASIKAPSLRSIALEASREDLLARASENYLRKNRALEGTEMFTSEISIVREEDHANCAKPA